MKTILSVGCIGILLILIGSLGVMSLSYSSNGTLIEEALMQLATTTITFGALFCIVALVVGFTTQNTPEC